MGRDGEGLNITNEYKTFPCSSGSFFYSSLGSNNQDNIRWRYSYRHSYKPYEVSHPAG